MFDAMRYNEQKLLATINNTNDLIWSVGKDLKIIYCNKAFQDFFLNRAGVPLDEGDLVLGSWNSPSFIERRTHDYSRALAGETFTIVIEDHFNGFVQYNEISSSPIIDQEGRITGVNCIARDITRQRRTLINVREQNEKLKEIARKKTKKVKDQLTEVLLSVNSVHTEMKDNDRYNSVSEKILSVGEELDQIIKDILFVSRNIDENYPDTEDIIARL